MDKSELRLDPLTRDWTIFNEARALPPTNASALDDTLPESPFRAGLEHFTPKSLHQASLDGGWQVRVVPNRLPVLRVEGEAEVKMEGPYQHLDGVGAHEIIIEDPGTRRFEDLPQEQIALVIQAWAVRIRDLIHDVRMRSFSIVKNIGRAAGQTIGHSVSQLVAMAIVPPSLRRKLRHATEHYKVSGRSVFADIIEHERRAASRVVFENADFIVFCPYAARSPFELAIWPRRDGPDFHRIREDETASLAAVLRLALRKVNRALGHPPIHLQLTTAPTRSPDDGWPTIESDFRWHLTLSPVLHPHDALTAATGCHVNGVWPEVAADFLRTLPDAP